DAPTVEVLQEVAEVFASDADADETAFAPEDVFGWEADSLGTEEDAPTAPREAMPLPRSMPQNAWQPNPIRQGQSGGKRNPPRRELRPKQSAMQPAGSNGPRKPGQARALRALQTAQNTAKSQQPREKPAAKVPVKEASASLPPAKEQREPRSTRARSRNDRTHEAHATRHPAAGKETASPKAQPSQIQLTFDWSQVMEPNPAAEKKDFPPTEPSQDKVSPKPQAQPSVPEIPSVQAVQEQVSETPSEAKEANVVRKQKRRPQHRGRGIKGKLRR
ncbi:MAG: hypothetical protein IJJ26_05855, partial [Victivallales bacterium]|nr:hypothetical protein [Victivallales bacterium]